VRRCLGASFAMFEMKQVLAAIARSVRLRPADPAPEKVARRAITFTPGRGATVVATFENGRPRAWAGWREGGVKPAMPSAEASVQ
jgi:hypothetical protein